MRICIISRWNASCGISLHAELIGRELVRRGHDVAVIAPTIESANEDWHHKVLDVDDEEWVYRCYEESDTGYGRVSHDCIRSLKCDIVLIELYGRLPYISLSESLYSLSRSARIVVVVHSATLDEVKALEVLPHDAIVVFDERYINELLSKLALNLKGKVHIIPYPCVENVEAKPYRPDFANGKILFFSFGRQPPNEYEDYIRVLRRLRNRYDLIYWIVRSDHELPIDYEWVIQWRGRPPLNIIYSYLRGSDIHLLPKSKIWSGKVVVSSTIYQTLASQTPIITPYTRYTETIPTNKDGFGVVVKYKDLNDLERKIIELIDNEEVRKYVISEALRFVEENGVSRITDKYLKLFNSLS